MKQGIASAIPASNKWKIDTISAGSSENHYFNNTTDNKRTEVLYHPPP